METNSASKSRYSQDDRTDTTSTGKLHDIMNNNPGTQDVLAVVPTMTSMSDKNVQLIEQTCN